MSTSILSTDIIHLNMDYHLYITHGILLTTHRCLLTTHDIVGAFTSAKALRIYAKICKKIGLFISLQHPYSNQLSNCSWWIFLAIGLQDSLVSYYFIYSDGLENLGSKCLYLHPVELLSKRELRQYYVSPACVNENFLLGPANVPTWKRILLDVNVASIPLELLGEDDLGKDALGKNVFVG